MLDLSHVYEKELEMFLSTLSIYKGDKVVNVNLIINEENRNFIKKQFIRMKGGNIEESILDEVLDEMLPYLYEKR